jgi:transposase
MKTTPFTSKDKAKIALDAVKEAGTTSELAKKYNAHPVQVGKWKKLVTENLHLIFDTKNSESTTIATLKSKVDELHRIIGQRDEELAWLQKKITP